jgi:hypothetical protein
MKTLSEVDAAYLAGIIDGERMITLTRTHRGENRRLVVSISRERPLTNTNLCKRKLHRAT